MAFAPAVATGVHDAASTGWTSLFTGHFLLRAVRRLQCLPNRDALTGVLNRRGFEIVLAGECARLKRGSPGFALLSLDLDHVKRIIDPQGHSRRDATLVAVARVLQSTARRVDHVARMGGGAFAVLRPDTRRAETLQTAGRFLGAARAEAHLAVGLPESMTVRIGGIADDGSEPIDSRLRRLDETLCHAKAAGRDRVAGLGDDAPPAVGSALAG